MLKTVYSFFTFLWLARKTWLTKSYRTYFSQFGEDAVLRELISLKKNRGFFVDVGAYHPKKFSNTYMLYKRGWRGINVDMDPVKILSFNLARSDDHNVCAAVSDKVENVTIYNFSKFGLGSTIDLKTVSNTEAPPTEKREVQTITLAEILEKSAFKNREIDLLSIDTEGVDFKVLTSFDIDVYKPKIIVIESMLRSIPEIMECEIYKYLIMHSYQLVSWVHLSMIFKRN